MSKHFSVKISNELRKNGQKMCGKCKTILSLDNFYPSKRGDYSCYCKDCQARISKEKTKQNSLFKAITLSIDDLPFFKPKSKAVSIYESRALNLLGYKWCPECSSVKKLSDFRTLHGRSWGRCVKCDKKRDLEYKASHKKSYKKSEETKRKNKIFRSSQEYKDRRNLKLRNRYSSDPVFRIYNSIRNMTRRLLKNKKNRHSLDYTGLESVEDFISKMSSKTNNPNWMSDGYQLDHIWQVSWFSDFMKVNCNSPEQINEAIMVINNYDNLRPLEFYKNSSRDRLDFEPLVKNDLEKYRKFLNADLLKMIEDYFKAKPD